MLWITEGFIVNVQTFPLKNVIGYFLNMGVVGVLGVVSSSFKGCILLNFQRT